jgi:hypothetical protein
MIRFLSYCYKTESQRILTCLKIRDHYNPPFPQLSLLWRLKYSLSLFYDWPIFWSFLTYQQRGTTSMFTISRFSPIKTAPLTFQGKGKGRSYSPPPSYQESEDHYNNSRKNPSPEQSTSKASSASEKFRHQQEQNRIETDLNSWIGSQEVNHNQQASGLDPSTIAPTPPHKDRFNKIQSLITNLPNRKLEQFQEVKKELGKVKMDGKYTLGYQGSRMNPYNWTTTNQEIANVDILIRAELKKRGNE